MCASCGSALLVRCDLRVIERGHQQSTSYRIAEEGRHQVAAGIRGPRDLATPDQVEDVDGPGDDVREPRRADDPGDGEDNGHLRVFRRGELRGFHRQPVTGTGWR